MSIAASEPMEYMERVYILSHFEKRNEHGACRL